jgi:GTP cyclohydrolase I
MKLDERTIFQLADLLPKEDVDIDTIREATKNILQAIGEDPDREGLKNTPERIARMYLELLAGYRVDPVAMINDACFEVTYDEMVVVRDIEFYSLCEHIYPKVMWLASRKYPVLSTCMPAACKCKNA